MSDKIIEELWDTKKTIAEEHKTVDSLVNYLRKVPTDTSVKTVDLSALKEH